MTSAAPLTVAMASSEVAPFARTGGLGDVLGSLPQALGQAGIPVSVIMPAYRTAIAIAGPLEQTGLSGAVPISTRRERFDVLKGSLAEGVPMYFVHHARYFDRDGLYGDPTDYADNAERFTFFSRATLEVARSLRCRVLHCHDWQAAMAIAFLRAQPAAYHDLRDLKTVLTIHNLAYQGLFWGLDWHLLNLDPVFFRMPHLEFYGKINFLKGGLVFADAITTVSPTYAKEVQTAEYGFGLDGVLRQRAGALRGILNGVDYGSWDPRTDPHLPRNYDAEQLGLKNECKAGLQSRMGFARKPEVPLIAIVSRLVTQKGMELVQRALDRLLERDVQLVVLGNGERQFEAMFQAAASLHSGCAAVRIGFDDALAHQMLAGADMFLMPSLYEPCGLTQMYAMRYGCVPIVRATGGLRDTVSPFQAAEELGTGFTFASSAPEALLAAVDAALEVYRQPDQWRRLMRRAMAEEFSWKGPAMEYADLYRSLLRAEGGPTTT